VSNSERFSTANDNAPLRVYPLAVNTRFAAVPQPAPASFSTKTEFAPVQAPQNDVGATRPQRNLLKTAILFALITAMCASLLGAERLGLGFMDCIGILAGGSLAFTAIAKSRIALIVSAAAALLWAGYNFANPTAQSVMFFAFPAIWSVQIYLASHLKSRASIIIGNIAGYYWLIGHGLAFMAAGSISPAMALTALFMAGTVHYRSGKSAEDEGAYGHETHTYFGWVFAMLGAVFVSHYWLFPDNVLWQNMKATAMGTIGWKVAIALGISAIYLSMMVRWKHYRVSALTVISLTLICALIPATLWWETSLRRIFEATPSFSAAPTIGILIAAGTMTAGLALAVNGVRRGRIMMILAGLFGAGVQGILLANPVLIKFENILIFLISLTFAMCVTGMLARSSLTQSRES